MGGGGVHLPLPLLRASMSKSEYEMHNIFRNYSSHNHHNDTQKYTLEYTQLNNFYKMFSEENNPKSPSNKTEQHYIRTTRQHKWDYKTTLLSHKYTPHV